MYKVLTRKLKDYFSHNRVSISGEICVKSNNTRNILNADEYDIKIVNEGISKFKNNNYFINVEKKYELNEFCIKLFCHKKNFTKELFLESLQVELEELILCLSINSENIIMINIFGNFNQKSKQISFRYLNKGNNVRYKMESIEKKRFIDWYNFNLIKLAIILGMICYVGYYNYICNLIEKNLL